MRFPTFIITAVLAAMAMPSDANAVQITALPPLNQAGNRGDDSLSIRKLPSIRNATAQDEEQAPAALPDHHTPVPQTESKSSLSPQPNAKSNANASFNPGSGWGIAGQRWTQVNPSDDNGGSGSPFKPAALQRIAPAQNAVRQGNSGFGLPAVQPAPFQLLPEINSADDRQSTAVPAMQNADFGQAATVLEVLPGEVLPSGARPNSGDAIQASSFPPNGENNATRSLPPLDAAENAARQTAAVAVDDAADETLNDSFGANLWTPPESNAFRPAPTGASITWWKPLVRQPLDSSNENLTAESVDTNTLVYRTLQNSPRIQAVSQDPLIRELQIIEADSAFDTNQYIRSQFEDRVDPVGNSLTVGSNESFLKDNIWSSDLGLQRKARNGANWELNQRLGFQNSNSNFFVPQDQGTATLALNVTQPLLRGRGVYYNESQILLAQASGGAAWQTFHAELQDELLGVVSAYWDLYLDRSVYLQKQANVRRGEDVLQRLVGRQGLDSIPSQIARARSSVQTRTTELANALRDVRNTETDIRRRIADTSWMGGSLTELIPGELPAADTFELPLEQVVYNALEHRPEVREVMNRARIATIQRDVSANELMPELSLLMGTYVSALRGETGILNAFQDQFGQVKPGYNVGFNFEVPYGNRAARSRFAQRKLQVKKIKHEVDEVMQRVIAESQIALRRVDSAAETLVAASEAIAAARADMVQFEQRWEAFALVEGDLADGRSPTIILDQLLDSHDRLASAELVYVQAERELKVSEVALQRAMGTLLMRQNVSAMATRDQDDPQMNLFKDGASIPSGGFSGVPTRQSSIDVQQPILGPSNGSSFVVSTEFVPQGR